MKINKISILVVVTLLAVLTIVIAGVMTTTHNANALTTNDGREIYVPGVYTIHNDGTVTYDKFNGPTSHTPDTSSISASASKSDSAAGANSKTEIKCLMFCAAFSNTNAGSAASNSNSDSSRINSPSAVSSNPITTTTIQVKSEPSSSSLSPVECIDNTGSSNDEGYAQGYHATNSYDNTLHNHHTQDYQTGYHDGYNAGFSDGKIGVNKTTC